MLIPHLEIVFPLDRIKKELFAHGRAGGVYYSEASCWWSHHRSHAYAKGSSMKCPLGGQVFFERDWNAWLETAAANPGHYGAHGLDALVAAHHGNCRNPQTGGAFAARTWTPYNRALDALAHEESRVG